MFSRSYDTGVRIEKLDVRVKEGSVSSRKLSHTSEMQPFSKYESHSLCHFCFTFHHRFTGVCKQSWCERTDHSLFLKFDIIHLGNTVTCSLQSDLLLNLKEESGRYLPFRDFKVVVLNICTLLLALYIRGQLYWIYCFLMLLFLLSYCL